MQSTQVLCVFILSYNNHIDVRIYVCVCLGAISFPGPALGCIEYVL